MSLSFIPLTIKSSCSCSLFHRLICATLLVCCLMFPVAGNNETDRLALLEFKAKISEDPLGVMNSWNDTLHFCDWYGITCGRKHQRVTILDLQSSKLTGILSPYLGNLSFLIKLHLQNNNFGGAIPSEIGRLHKLQTLRLYANSLEGEIPSNISSCYSFVLISLAENKLVGGIPHELGSLPNLQYLFLTRNNLTGNIPSSIGNLSSLVMLSIGENKLVGRILNSLGKLKSLTVLNLDDNKFFGEVPPSIFNLSSLETLDISMNGLEGNLPSNLGNTLSQIQELIVFHNRFNGHLPASISNCSALENLDLSENNFQGQVPSLHKLARLNHLVLHNNSLGDGQVGDLGFIYSLANASSLKWLEIGQNNFHGVFPKIICNFSSLFAMYLRDNFLTGEIPNCIENVANLYYFGASNNALSGAFPPGLWKLQNLNLLSFYGNKLSGVIPNTIRNLTKVSIIDLSNNYFQGQIPSSLGNCISLILLDLSNNKFSGSIPLKLFNLSPFSIQLNLSRNQLTGSLPEEVGTLNSIDTLDVSRNMLSGKIPSSLGSCVSLEFLYMGGNKLEGTIPHSFTALKGLLDLDLSNNNLSGEVPNFLASLRLQRLDLSRNHFEGQVPLGGVFNNTNNISIFGNDRLCGGIPKLKLPLCKFSHNSHKKRPDHKRKIKLYAIFSGLFGVILLVVILVFCYIFCLRKRDRHPTISSDSESFPFMSYQTLLKATNGFSSENLIGSGAFGDVYKGILTDDDGLIVAIKVFNLEYLGALKSFMAECRVLRRIRHRNLVKVITSCSSVDYQGKDFKALIYEYMVNGSLEEWIHPKEAISDIEGTNNNASKKLNIVQRLNIAVDVAFALDYLHHHCGSSIVHCDLKPSNVLLDDDMVAHVSDFGLAKFLQKDIESSHVNHSSSIGVKGTIGYTPPEYGIGNELTTYGDVYSFGILLLEMFTGKRPTDEMFKDGLSLSLFVSEALPQDMTLILDHTLLEDIDREESDNKMMSEALNSIFGIALSCTNENPRERLDISDVAAKLSPIRNKLLKTCSRRQRRRVLAFN